MNEKLHPSELEIAIANIQRRKRAARIVPAHALMVKEIFKEVKYPASEIREVLRELCRAGRITYEETPNDVGFKTKQP
jgi:reverse gyrase